MTDLQDVETHSYDSEGVVTAETVLKFDDTEFVIVESEAQDEHKVYEREPGETEPHTYH